MQLNIKFWLKFSLLNLCIVAFLGVIMRYKIGFEFPFLDQKYLQHSHSHFAFSGWVSHTLMTLMVYYLQTKVANFRGNKYKKLIIANLICAYGMLVFFIIQGYGLFSITFSTASVLVSYAFAYQFVKDLKLLDDDLLAKYWMKAALFFNVLSSIGTFYLAYMMATKSVIQDFYLASIYFYLHFQYNGWFLFASIGLFFGLLNLRKSEHPFYYTFYKLFALACIPAYFLSILWIKLPVWLYAVTVLAALVQVFAWFKFLVVIWKNNSVSFKKYSVLLQYIFWFICFCLSIKLLLQLGSTVPAISQLAFGTRAVVIAYLHLVLLAIISLFIFFYIYTSKLFTITKSIKYGVIIFIVGVMLNEIVLGVQGIAAFTYILIPYVNEMLFGAAVLLLFGIIWIAYYSIKRDFNKASL